MKKLFIFLPFIMLLSLSQTGCNTKGCIDPNAENYNPDANTDDGSCDYGDNFFLDFKLNMNGTPLEMNTEYTDSRGDLVKYELVRFYIDNIYLVQSDGSETLVKETDLVDFTDASTQTISASLPAGSYTGLRFGIGLDPIHNAADPATLPSSDPLSVFENMYWGWTSKYIFSKIEGRVDTSNSGSDYSIFLYHVGLDSLYREKTYSGESISLAEDTDTRYAISIDMEDVFLSASDAIDYNDPDENFTHATGSGFPLAERIADNFAAVFVKE